MSYEDWQIRIEAREEGDVIWLGGSAHIDPGNLLRSAAFQPAVYPGQDQPSNCLSKNLFLCFCESLWLAIGNQQVHFPVAVHDGFYHPLYSRTVEYRDVGAAFRWGVERIRHRSCLWWKGVR